MSKIEDLEKRIEHLETEVELLKELVKLQSKSREDWYIPAHPSMPMQPYYSKEPTLNPPYKVTCEGGRLMNDDISYLYMDSEATKAFEEMDKEKK